MWEFGDDGIDDARTHMFEQMRFNSDLVLGDVVNLHIIDGIRKMIGSRCGFAIGGEGNVNGKLIANHLLFFKAAMIGIKGHFFEFY